MTYKQALALGSKDWKICGYAGAAETIARRLGLNPKCFYEWAKRHEVDLIGKGHLIIKNHSLTLEAFLSDTGLTF